MKILIYYPFNTKSVAIHSQAELLLKLGHEVYLLTWTPEGELHTRLRELGVKSYSAYSPKSSGGLRFFIQQTNALVRFCRINEITVVLSHLQGAGMVSGLAKSLRKLKVFYFRHNTDYFQLKNSRKDLFINKLANSLPDKIVAISDKVKEQLLKEGVKEGRIERINLCYDFNDYPQPSPERVQQIRQNYQASMLLIAAARLDPLKRFELMFDAVKQLVSDGLDVKLIVIGDGPEKEKLSAYIKSQALEHSVMLLGYVNNVMDYFTASDMLIHLSYSEASSHVAKEAGYCKKPVLVCKDVGDFDEYLIHNQNAFIVDKENPLAETISHIKENYNNKEKLQRLGAALHDTIIQRFSIGTVSADYQKLLKDLNHLNHN